MIFKLRRIISLLLIASVLILFGMTAAAEGTLLGDADSNGSITLLDATCIQRKLAGMPEGDSFSARCADADGNGEIEITDATIIQRWLVKIDTPYSDLIGEPLYTPTEAPTQRPTDEEGWGTEIKI